VMLMIMGQMICGMRRRKQFNSKSISKHFTERLLAVDENNAISSDVMLSQKF